MDHRGTIVIVTYCQRLTIEDYIMGKKIPWDSIALGTVLPDGMYNVYVESFEESFSKTGKLMYRSRYRVEEPDQFANMVLFDNYVIGTEDDLTGEDPDTWKGSFGAKKMKQIRNATGITAEDVDEFIEEIVQQKLTVAVTTDPEAPGGPTNRVNGFYKPGSKTITVKPVAKKKKMSKKLNGSATALEAD